MWWVCSRHYGIPQRGDQRRWVEDSLNTDQRRGVWMGPCGDGKPLAQRARRVHLSEIKWSNWGSGSWNAFWTLLAKSQAPGLKGLLLMAFDYYYWFFLVIARAAGQQPVGGSHGSSPLGRSPRVPLGPIQCLEAGCSSSRFFEVGCRTSSVSFFFDTNCPLFFET